MSDIGHVNLFGYNLLLQAIETLLVDAVSLIFKNGINIGKILEMLGLDFVNLAHTHLDSYEEYFILFTSPIFDLELMADRTRSFLASMVTATKDSAGIEIKKEHISQVLGLVKDEINSNPEAKEAVSKIMNHIS